MVEKHEPSCEGQTCLCNAFSHANRLRPLVSYSSSMTHLRWTIREFVRRNGTSRRLFPDLAYELRRALGNCASKGCKLVLDLGCGSSSPLEFLSRSSTSVGIDIFQPAIEESMRAEIHDQYFLMDARYLDRTFKPKSFDCVVALTLIEHLEKDDGVRLLEMMETIARKKVVISTPNGFLAQSADEFRPNIWMAHRSGWTVEEMRKKGYTVIGVGGWKRLRRKNGRRSWSPNMFWSLVSRLTQLFVRNKPESAFGILCVKDLESKPLLMPNQSQIARASFKKSHCFPV